MIQVSDSREVRCASGNVIARSLMKAGGWYAAPEWSCIKVVGSWVGMCVSIFCLRFRCWCFGIEPKVINCRPANTRDTHWGDYCWNRSNFIGRATYLVGKLGAEGGDLERRIASRLSTALQYHPCLISEWSIQKRKTFFHQLIVADILTQYYWVSQIVWPMMIILITGLWARHHCLGKVNAPSRPVLLQ